MGSSKIWMMDRNHSRPASTNTLIMSGPIFYYIPTNDTPFELSVFWPSDTESRIFGSVSLSFKTRLTSVTVFAATYDT